MLQLIRAPNVINFIFYPLRSAFKDTQIVITVVFYLILAISISYHFLWNIPQSSSHLQKCCDQLKLKSSIDDSLQNTFLKICKQKQSDAHQIGINV